MTKAKDLLRILDEFEATPESVGIDLRLDLADLIIAQLDRKRWTQKRLAQRCGMKESFVSRIIHAESNCTFDVAGRLLHALGVKPKLTVAQTKPTIPLIERAATSETGWTQPFAPEAGITYGQEESRSAKFQVVGTHAGNPGRRYRRVAATHQSDRGQHLGRQHAVADPQRLRYSHASV